MNKFKFLLAAVLLAPLSAVAGEPYVTNLVFRQNWPWNGKVSINFTLVADTGTDLDITATHAGGAIDLTQAGLNLQPLFVMPGDCHLEWDPAAAGYGELKDLKIAVAPCKADHTYLVFDLTTGAHEYLAAVPEGGWTEEYKTTKFVFRRIPAGTFTMGCTQEIFDYLGLDSTNDKWLIGHTVTLTHDYYFAIFPLTQAQYAAVTDGSPAANTKLQVQGISHTNLRGEQSEVNWPATGYAVAETSFLSKFRQRVGASFLVDLATEAQWERAARAGSSGIWYSIDGYPKGGTPDELGEWGSEACTNFLQSIASTSGDVGQKQPNAWGIYDLIGLYGEVGLDFATNSKWGAAFPDYSTDPVGLATSTARIQRGSSWNGADFGKEQTVHFRGVTAQGQRTSAARLAIHLVPLFK